MVTCKIHCRNPARDCSSRSTAETTRMVAIRPECHSKGGENMLHTYETRAQLAKRYSVSVSTVDNRQR